MSAHLYYQGDLDLALRGWVVPALERCKPAVDRWFFLRYWDGGNHLRVRLASPDPTSVRAVLQRTAAAFLDRCPSPELMSADDYRRLAEVLAAAEQRAVGGGLRPNNTLTFESYRPEHQRYGYGPALDAVEQHFAEASRLALAVVRAGAGRAERLSLAFGWLLTAWYRGARRPADLVELVEALVGAWSQRAGHWTATDDGGWPARYDRARDALVQQADRVQRGDTDALTGEWWASLDRLHGRLLPLVIAGTYRPERRTGWGTGDDPVRSTWSVLDLCAHLTCNRLGLTSVDEAYLRYAAVRATAELLGGSPGPLVPGEETR